MLARLKAVFGKRRERIADEYATMTPQERRSADMLRERGPEGERELIVEQQAERREDAAEGRPHDA